MTRFDYFKLFQLTFFTEPGGVSFVASPADTVGTVVVDLALGVGAASEVVAGVLAGLLDACKVQQALAVFRAFRDVSYKVMVPCLNHAIQKVDRKQNQNLFRIFYPEQLVWQSIYCQEILYLS